MKARLALQACDQESHDDLAELTTWQSVQSESARARRGGKPRLCLQRRVPAWLECCEASLVCQPVDGPGDASMAAAKARGFGNKRAVAPPVAPPPVPEDKSGAAS